MRCSRTAVISLFTDEEMGSEGLKALPEVTGLGRSRAKSCGTHLPRGWPLPRLLRLQTLGDLEACGYLHWAVRRGHTETLSAPTLGNM